VGNTAALDGAILHLGNASRWRGSWALLAERRCAGLHSRIIGVPLFQHADSPRRCAGDNIGHDIEVTAATPASNVMNSRRRMFPALARLESSVLILRQCRCAVQGKACMASGTRCLAPSAVVDPVGIFTAD
jgi:hypothetical protein